MQFCFKSRASSRQKMLVLTLRQIYFVKSNLFYTFTSPSEKQPLHISHKSQQGETYANHIDIKKDFFISLKPDILGHYVSVPELKKHKFEAAIYSIKSIFKAYTEGLHIVYIYSCPTCSLNLGNALPRAKLNSINWTFLRCKNETAFRLILVSHTRLEFLPSFWHCCIHRGICHHCSFKWNSAEVQ